MEATTIADRAAAEERQKERAQRNRRRYYLHRRVRMFARLDTRHKTVCVPFLFEPEGKQAEYFRELRERWGYAVQAELPEE